MSIFQTSVAQMWKRNNMMKKLIYIFTIVGLISTCGSREPTRVDPVLDLDNSIGSVCGMASIRGTNESSISNGGCGINNPVKVYAVSGIKLSSPALINCETARTLDGWVNSSLKPQAKAIGRTVTEMNMMGAYACRTRNHRAGAKLSEHSKGNAIDIGGFTFADGETVTLLNDYYSSPYKSFMSNIRAGACGPFGTVLGPGTDSLHANHFHFDIARYSMGAYCK